MAIEEKKVIAPKKEIKPNIENLVSLKKEFSKGEMLPRKLVMLKARLVELYLKKQSTEDELAFLESIFKRERIKGAIQDDHLEILNRIEMARCTDKCIVKTADVPRTHYLNKDQECFYYIDEDTDRYVVFVERKIPPEWQMTRDLLLKEQRGHFADESEYPKEKTLIHRLNLTDAEFNAWFDFVEDLLSEPVEKEETYKF